MKYKLNMTDVDKDEDGTLFLWLPPGFRFYDELVHCRGFDTLKELRAAVRDDVIPCDCFGCAARGRVVKKLAEVV